MISGEMLDTIIDIGGLTHYITDRRGGVPRRVPRSF